MWSADLGLRGDKELLVEGVGVESPQVSDLSPSWRRRLWAHCYLKCRTRCQSRRGPSTPNGDLRHLIGQMEKNSLKVKGEILPEMRHNLLTGWLRLQVYTPRGWHTHTANPTSTISYVSEVTWVLLSKMPESGTFIVDLWFVNVRQQEKSCTKSP